MNQKLINKLYEARKEGKVNKEIEIAEKLGYFFLAGTIAKEHGLFNKAYKNFNKINQKKEIKIIEKIIYPKNYLTMRNFQRNKELYGGEDFKSKYKEKILCRKIKEKWFKQIKNSLTKKQKFLFNFGNYN